MTTFHSFWERYCPWKAKVLITPLPFLTVSLDRTVPIDFNEIENFDYHHFFLKKRGVMLCTYFFSREPKTNFVVLYLYTEKFAKMLLSFTENCDYKT